MAYAYAADQIRMPNFTAAMQAGERLKEARKRGNLLTARMEMEKRKMERKERYDEETRRLTRGLLEDRRQPLAPQTGSGDEYGYGSATEAPPTGAADGGGYGSGPDTGTSAGAPQARMRQAGMLRLEGPNWNRFALQRPEIAKKLYDIHSSANDAQKKELKEKSELMGRLAQAVLNAPEGMRRQDMYARARAAADRAGISTASWPAMPDVATLTTAIAVAGANKDLGDHFDRDKTPLVSDLDKARAAEVRSKTAERKRKATGRASFLRSIGREQPAPSGAGTTLKNGGAGGDVGFLEKPAYSITDDGTLINDAGGDVVIGQAADDDAVNDLIKPGKAPPTVKQIFDALPPEAQTGILYSDDPQQAFSKYLLQRNGINIRSDGKGGFEMQIGGAAGKIGGFGRRAQGKIQTQLLDALALRPQLAAMYATNRRDYHLVGKKLGMAWDAFKEKWFNKKLSPEDKEKLAGFTDHMSKSVKMFTDVLKALSGVAINPEEIKRAKNWLPNVDRDPFKGDSPTQYDAKLRSFVDFTNNAIARLHYTNRHGVDIQHVTLDSMPTIIKRRGDELENEMIKRGLKGDALKTAVTQQIAQEFGFVSQ